MGRLKKSPGHVAICALGPSLDLYVDMCKRHGGRHRFADETWGVNAVGGVLQCDRVFHMDDVELQERRAAANPKSNIAGMLEWMREHPGPIYTSRTEGIGGYPGLVAFPYERVINSLGFSYFNNTVPYAVAYALWIGVKRVSLFGCDYTYASSHKAEKGRACLEWWMGFARAHGVEFSVAGTSTLQDACEPDQPYGYDAYDVHLDVKDGVAKVNWNRVDLPTAEEIEARYDHTRHPNTLVERAAPA